MAYKTASTLLWRTRPHPLCYGGQDRIRFAMADNICNIGRADGTAN
jgi:hypothetical protein